MLIERLLVWEIVSAKAVNEWSSGEKLCHQINEKVPQQTYLVATFGGCL